MKARTLMTPNVLSVPEDMPLTELASFLIEQEISGAVVRDVGGELTGVVSLTDLASHVKERGEVTSSLSRPDFYVHGWEESFEKSELLDFHIEDSTLRVRDIMSPRIYTVGADADISEVAQEMLNYHVHRLLVTEGGDPVGVVTTSDFLQIFAGGPPAVRRAFFGEVTESAMPDVH